jgi:hypothetical protein
VGSVREEISRCCHGGPKRARSRKQRTQPRKAYSLPGLLYSERLGFFNKYDSQSAGQVSSFTYVFFEASHSLPSHFFCFFLLGPPARKAESFLGVKVMRSFLDGLPAILDKCSRGECRFVDGYVEYVLSFSDLP